MAKRTDEQTKVLAELVQMTKKLAEDFDDVTIRVALHNRTVMLGRICGLSPLIDRWASEEAARITDEDPKMTEWRRDLALENTVAGRIRDFRDRIVETIKLQCSNITSEMIEVQSDRKFTGGAR